MSCFVLSDDYGCTEALWLWKWLYTMSCLVQEPEENVNIINNYIQITHKSTYLKTYLKKEIWSKKNGSFSSTQAPHQQVISHTKIPDKVNSSHFHFLTNGLKTVLDSASCSSPFSLSLCATSKFLCTSSKGMGQDGAGRGLTGQDRNLNLTFQVTCD